ncbi:hypothetical protein [Roseomonas rosulenta]|uniref:hypothetical protein n=1 Tax=Roseomonas rosulenta TaxID=2748667 RepID=UPI0018DF79DE|nr:hypothetical protein [Roseomonas rosulenta]
MDLGNALSEIEADGADSRGERLISSGVTSDDQFPALDAAQQGLSSPSTSPTAVA